MSHENYENHEFRKHLPRKPSALRFLSASLVLGAVLAGCFGTDNGGNGGENEPPVITAQPVNATAAAGDTASFSVTATDALDYQWIRGEADTLASETMATLELTDVTVELDGTTYKVVVSNTYGSVTSNSAALTVALTPPGILTQPADTLIAAGDTVMLAVGAAGSDLSYQWSKDGDTLTGATSATLAIEDVSYDQYGRYTVSVTNDGGSVVSDTAVVLVNGPDAARAVLIEYGGNGLDGNAAVFQNCTGCHYPGGVGHAGVAPPLANSDHIQNNRERIIEVLLRGGGDWGGDSILVNGLWYYPGNMPGWSDLSDFDIASVLTYIRAALNDSVVVSCDADTLTDEGFATCQYEARAQNEIDADSVAVWEVTAMRDSLANEGIPE